jgi:hypothetical protein
MNEIKVCCVPPAFKFKQLCFIDGGHNHSGGRATYCMRAPMADRHVYNTAV